MTHSRTVAPLLAALTLPFATSALAGFIEDSKGSLELRNFYLNRDFRQAGAPQSKAEEWAQGFTARIESGFTEGTVGVGLDAIGELGVKLDSSPDRRGTGLLPFDPTIYSHFLHMPAWAIAMGITMFLQFKLNPAPPDPVQAKVFAWMPLIFTFMLASFPAGLVIYWTWSNLLTITQQWFIMRRHNREA